jgi:hypothetical protein
LPTIPWLNAGANLLLDDEARSAVWEQSRLLVVLHAAEGLERRAREIHEWPVDEGIIARVLTIATSVAAITVARLILDPIGL